MSTISASDELLHRAITGANRTVAKPRVIICTLERTHGSTGVHTHTRMLHGGISGAGYPCRVVNPFCGSRKWIPIFGIRRAVVDHLSRTWGTRWYRHWHFVALKENLLKDISKNPTAVVIAQCPSSARAAMEVRNELGANYRVVFVCHFNQSEAEEYRARGELADERSFQKVLQSETEILRGVDQVIYVSHWARDVVEKNRGIQPKASAVILNGISEAVEVPDVSRDEIGVETDELVLMNVGTLEPRKNQISLLDLFAQVSKLTPNAHLVLVGEGEQRGEIEKKIKSLGLKEKVTLLGHRRDVPALLKIADIYVHYAKLENCPVALLEAARAGLPSAALPVGGITELQEMLGSVTPLDESNIEASVAALRPILQDTGLRKSISDRARLGFAKHFTSAAMVGAYLAELALR